MRLDIGEFFGYMLWRATEPGAVGNQVAHSGQAGPGGGSAVVGGVDLRRGQSGHAAQRRQHFELFFEPRRGLADGFLLAVGEMDLQHQGQALAQGAVASGLHSARAPLLGDFQRPAPGGYHPLDVVLEHEFDAARVGAEDGLPALDGSVRRAWDQGDFFDRAAAVRHAGRKVVVGALMGEGLLVPGLENELDLLLEERAIGRGVLQRTAQGRQLARNIAAAAAEAEAPAGKEVGLGHVLG